MKRFISFVVLFVVSILIIASSNGVTTSQSLDRTGSPVGTTQCGACHSGGNYNPTLLLRLKNSDGDIVTEYVPQQSYTLEVVFGGNTAPRYGMQAVALVNGTNANAGSLSAANNKSKTSTLNSRIYADHNGFVSSNTFELNWTAPAQGTGNISFYAAGIAANGSGSSGDSPVTASPLSLTEEQPTDPDNPVEPEDPDDSDDPLNPEDPENPLNPENPNSINPVENLLWSIYPNPVIDFLLISNRHLQSAKISLINLSGKIIENHYISNENYLIDFSGYPSGIYFLLIESDGIQINKKILKN
jgi:hypothetical protein